MHVRVTVCLSVCLSTSDFEDPVVFALEMCTDELCNKLSPLNVSLFFILSYFREKRVEVEMQLYYFTRAPPPPTNVNILSRERGHHLIIVLKCASHILLLLSVPGRFQSNRSASHSCKFYLW